MAKKKGFDAILGVSKKMIHSDVSKPQDKKSEEAKQQLSSITQKNEREIRGTIQQSHKNFNGKFFDAIK